MLPVAILAGGLGTRVRHRTGPALPKAMLPVAGSPFIDHKLRELRAAGCERVVMLLGHGGHAIVDHVGSGTAFGLLVQYVHDPPGLLGTGGAIRHALPELGSDFIVTYGDTLLDVPLDRLERRLLSNQGALGVMTVLENMDRWETSNVDVEDGLVTMYEKSPRMATHTYLDYGMLAMRSEAFKTMPEILSFDLGTTIRHLIEGRKLLAMTVTRRFYDIGNEASIRATEAYLRTSQLA